MKALFVTLLFPVLLKSCEGVPDQVGAPPPPVPHTSGANSPGSIGSTDNTGGANNTTDVPFDAGLSFLLVAGAGYGVKRYRNSKKPSE